MYYMAVMDCDDNIHNTIGSDHFSWIRITAVMKANENHLPYDKQGVIWTDQLLLLIYCVLFFLVSVNTRSFSDTFGTVNTPHIYCLIAMAMQAFAIRCDLTHWNNYADNGEGFLALEVASQIFDILSECIMTLLILMLANGWYTRFKTYDMGDGMDTYGIFFVLLIMMHIIFIILS